MSTRSNIAVEHCNGTVSDIYCHSDGYLSGVGLCLYQYWNSTSMLRRLIALGDISSIGDDLDDVNAYARDRADTFEPARKSASVETYQEKCTTISYRQNWGYEYMYLFTRKNGWLVKIYDKPWQPLHLALVEERLTQET